MLFFFFSYHVPSHMAVCYCYESFLYIRFRVTVFSHTRPVTLENKNWIVCFYLNYKTQEHQRNHTLKNSFLLLPVLICRMGRASVSGYLTFTPLLKWLNSTCTTMLHMRFILVSGQIQLRTLFSRPEGTLVRELPLYYNFRISLTFSQIFA